jgi:two-component system sensor histidine kinase CreC
MRDALEGKRYVERYVQSLTHEMKSPLSAIGGAAELLDEEMPDDRRALFLENIRTETGRMRDLVNRLLELAALENVKQLHHLEEVDLGGVACEVARSLAPALAAKDLRLEAGGADDRILVRGDAFLIRQAIANLLQNAVDFSPRGGTIGLAVARRDSDAAVTIRDQGPGIPEWALDKVFDHFYSLEHPDTGRKGTGLGLNFVREIAALHGGKARVVNLPGGGAEASLTVPLA